MKKLLLPIGSILLLAFLVGLGTACMAVLAGDGSSPTVTTDKRDYTSGETVIISGSGFEANAGLTVGVTRPDATVDSDAVTAEVDGSFQYDYVLDGIEGQYLVEVLDGAGTVLATTTFWDGHLDFTQCLNDSDNNNVRDDCVWGTGAINQNNSFYTEGDSVPQRVLREIDKAGSTTLVFEYAFTKDDIYAYDFLTDVAETQTGALLAACQGAPNWADDAGECDGSSTLYNSAVSVSIPSDGFGPATVSGHPAEKVSDAERADSPPREFKVSCAPSPCTSISLGSITHSPAATCYKNCDTSSVTISLTLTTPVNNTLVGVWFGGHLAESADPDPANSPPDGWGTGCSSDCGASSISGAPFHIRHEGHDNPISKSGIQPGGNVEICKDAVPNDPQDFSFAGSGGIGTFLLDDDSDAALPNCRTFSNIPPDQYAVTETMPPGWNLTSIVCVDPDNGSTASPPTANIDLDPAETVICTFTNSPSCTPTPPDNDCDGIDDDCDGPADEHYVAPVTNCGLGVCAATGHMICVNGGLQDTCTPGPATGADADCDNVDQDCDGPADEHYVPTPTSCGVGECADTGELTCQGGQQVDTCEEGTPGDEVCDGLDNDCDGSLEDDGVDEGWYGEPTSCGVGECADTGELTCQGGQQVDTCEEGTPGDEVCDGLDNDCDASVDEDHVCEADVRIVSQSFVSPPAEIDVSASVPVKLRKVLHNDGPYPDPVHVTVTKTATAPDDCTITPTNPSEQVELPQSVDVTHDEIFTIHCSQPSSHTFTVENDVSGPKEPLIVDPNMTNNVESTDLTVAAIAYADVKIISQSFVSPPTQIDVSARVEVLLLTVVHNNGPYPEPVEVTITMTATAPADCYIDLIELIMQGEVPYSVDVILGEGNTIHCSKPSSHTFTVKNVVSGPKDPHIIDPDMTNNSASTDLTVDAIAKANVQITSQALVSPPSQIDVGTSVPVTLRKHLHNIGPYGPVVVSITPSASAPADCTATPAQGNPTSASLPVSADVVVDEGWTIQCTKASTHTFTFNDAIAVTTLHVIDPDTTNNSKATQLTVAAIGHPDPQVVSVSVSGPAKIDVSNNVNITVNTTLQNSGYGPVNVTLTYSGSAPADCSATTVGTAQVVLPAAGQLVDNHAWTIHCSQPSDHTFSFTTTITAINDPHVVDTNLNNNSGSGSYSVETWAYSDLKVADQYFENPPAEIPASQNVVVTLDKVLHNNGPYGPVDAATETAVTVPSGCTASPNPHTQLFSSVPVSVDVLHHEPFVIHCSQLGPHTFTFDDKVEVTSAHVQDLESGNDGKVTQLTVTAVAKADVKITSASFVNPPTKIPLGEDVLVTLRMHIHNNGPRSPVGIAINSSASAPTGCTIAPKSVPTSISGVPVSVDQVVDEVWTVKCTQNTTLKTFVFDVSINVSTPFVSDPNLANNAVHKLLTVTDDPADPQGDMDGDGWTNGAEAVIGTDPADACPDDSSDDAWPPDVNNDASVDILDVLRYKGKLRGAYDCRYDLNTDGGVDILDVLLYKHLIGMVCTP